MKWILKALPIVLVLICTGESAFNDLRLRPSLAKKVAQPKQSVNVLNDFQLLSANRPTKTAFKPVDQPNGTVEAIIERLDTNGLTNQVCSFPAFNQNDGVQHFKLYSFGIGIEVLAIIKSHRKSAEDSLDIFVVNMTDCKFTKTEMLQGYNFTRSSGGAFMSIRPWDAETFDIFWLKGEDKCGSYMCKNTFNVHNRTVDERKKFLLPKQYENSVIFITASVNDEYFVVVRKMGKIKFLSVASNGTLIKKLECPVGSDKHMKLAAISTYNGALGICHISIDNETAIHCLQLNKFLKANVNVTLNDRGSRPLDLATYNLPQGGFLLLTLHCSTSNLMNCSNYEFKLTRIDVDGFHSEFKNFVDDNCIVVFNHRATFFEENGKVCLFYVCGVKREASYGKVLKSRCF